MANTTKKAPPQQILPNKEHALALATPRPQILLLNIENEVADALKQAGFNITTGSFGIPYKTSRSSNLAPVPFNSDLRDISEQDIVIVDTDDTQEPIDASPEIIADGLEHIWTSCKGGAIDPRPYVMQTTQSRFDRILNNGGLFIVFAEHKRHIKYTTGASSFRGLKKTGEDVLLHNWGFLSALNAVNTQTDPGRDIRITNPNHPLSTTLRNYLNDSSFSCTLSPNGPYTPYIANEWMPLATNRFDATVAALIAPAKNRRGTVIILPRVSRKKELLTDLLSNAIPDLAPWLFPDSNVGQWVHHPEYESGKILELHSQIAQIAAEAQAKIEQCQKRAQEEQTNHQHMYDLLRESGDPLVAAVKKALETIGFSDVVDMDAENQKQGRTSRLDEDLWIREKDKPLILAEVKGLNRLAPDAESLQAWKYVAPRMKELQRLDIRALAIINHQRGIPPLERENDKVFRPDIITNAEHNDFGLMTTWDLFRIVKNMTANEWRPEWVKPIFYRSGKILPLPEHYEPLGKVERLLEKISVASIRIEATDLKVGDRIAFIHPVSFYEQAIESMQVNKEARDQTMQGELAGIKTQIPMNQLKVGMEVFRIKRKI